MRDQAPLLTTKNAATYCAVSPRTLEKWRLVGGGPRYRKIGRRTVRYSLEDLSEFVESDVRKSTSDRGE